MRNLNRQITVKKSEKAQVAKVDTTTGGYQFDVLDGTLGPSVIDISSLYGDTGQFTYDPGFTSTASCESKITYIDGEKGILWLCPWLSKKSAWQDSSPTPYQCHV